MRSVCLVPPWTQVGEGEGRWEEEEEMEGEG